MDVRGVVPVVRARVRRWCGPYIQCQWSSRCQVPTTRTVCHATTAPQALENLRRAMKHEFRIWQTGVGTGCQKARNFGRRGAASRSVLYEGYVLHGCCVLEVLGISIYATLLRGSQVRFGNNRFASKLVSGWPEDSNRRAARAPLQEHVRGVATMSRDSCFLEHLFCIAHELATRPYRRRITASNWVQRI